MPAFITKGGKIYRVISDNLGSVLKVVDLATGTIAQSLVYNTFGEITSDSSPGFQPFGYAGGLYDIHTGLTRFGARDYDPETGRWMQKDPIGFAGGDTNLYRYVGNDPVNKIDPTGLSELVFNRAAGQLSVYNNQNQLVGTFPASNNAQRSSNGPFPNGTYNYSYTVNHTPDPNGPYGSNGNFVFNVPGRTGMGVHSGRASSTDRAGRSGVNYSTNGCVRTTDDATSFIRNLHRNDPVRSITVR